MIPQHWPSRVYHLFDRMLLPRLPVAMQRFVITCMLAIARHVFPSREWASSPERLLARRDFRRATVRGMPDWAHSDMNELALEIDPLLTPEHYLSKRPAAILTPVHWIQAGAAYIRLCEHLEGRQFDTVLLVPWLIRGGADLGALHHARACHEEFGQRTLVIATESRDSPWAARLPNGVHFLEAGHELAALSSLHHEPERVLSRLLIQLAPKRIHIINSELAWRTVGMFGKAIRQKSRIFASLYCDERDAQGRRSGLAQRHLPTAWRELDAIITDNSISPAEWERTLGLDSRLFRVIHFPAPERCVRQDDADDAPSMHRLLWASRLDRQKRPELLLELASRMRDFQWDIHGFPLTDDGRYVQSLGRLPNVTLHGGYERFQDIVRSDHLAYVYTTAWDGLPNVLLEAAATRLPIIAPDVGGIRDLLPEAALLGATADVEEYSVGIRRLADIRARENHLSMQDDRSRAFTWENFVAGMRELDGYT